MKKLSKIALTILTTILLSSTLVGCTQSGGGDTSTPTPTPTPTPSVDDGDGTESNPYSTKKACEIAKSLSSGGITPKKYFIKGKIVSGSINNNSVAQYGNSIFDISDDGTTTNKFKCYQVYYLNNQKFTSTTAAALKAGDEIVMFSKIYYYGGHTPETTDKGTAYVYKHNNQKSSTIPDQGGFPDEDPNAKVKTISALISENSSWKTEGAKSTTLYRITGIAQYATNTTYGNFDILDSTGYIYVRGCTGSKKGLVDKGDGNGKVINNDGQFSSIGIKPGDEVTIEGWYAYHKYTNSYGIPQFTGYVIKLVNKGASIIPNTSYTATETYSGSFYNSVSTLTGTELLKGLHNLMDTKHTNYVSYSSLDSHFDDTDKYGNGVKCFYSGEQTSKYNKEHVWPQSLSGSSTTQLYGEDHGGSDMLHIRPTISTYNSKRSSAMFGTIFGSGSYKGETITYQGGGYDYCLSNVFEPADAIKGDVARIVMYMYMHYNDGTISELSNISGWNKKSFYGEMHINWVMGPGTNDAFKLLRYWNALDPVSNEEMSRNNYAESIQGNRNPFVDHPSYADKIWG